MNVKFKCAAALICAITVLFALIPSAHAEKHTYSNTKNSGLRDEICLSLEGTGAEAYYTDGNEYGKLSALSESELLASLRTLMTSTHKYKSSYADSKNYADETDCQGGDGSIVLLYTSSVVKSSDFIGSGSIGWNREHVWPKSLGGFDNSGAGADLHHIRPDDVTTNAKRGNLKYGNAPSGSEVKGSSLVSGAVGGHSTGAYFEPLDNVKGDVARICLYVYARYGGELSKCSSITNVFESVDVLLDWCESDPVDTWEMGRNEVIEKIQGNRNVFIDYPEFAFLLFGREVPADMTTPSGMAKMPAGTTAESTTEAETTVETTTEEVTDAAPVTTETTTVTVTVTTESPSVTLTVTTESPSVTLTVTEAITESEKEKGCASSTAYCMIILMIPLAFALKRKNK